MAELDLFSLEIGAEFQQEAADSQSFNWKVPDRARGGKTKFWTEQLDVVESDMAVREENNEQVAVKVTFKAAAESEFTENVDSKPFRQQFILNYGSINGPKSGQKTMTLISVGKLNRLLHAAGLIDSPTPGNNVRYAEYFYGNNAPILGAKVFGLFKAYKDKEGVDRQEISQFDSLDAGATND